MIRTRKAYICIFDYPDDLDVEKYARYLPRVRAEKMMKISHEGARRQSMAAEFAYRAARIAAWKDVSLRGEQLFMEDPAEWTAGDYCYGTNGKPELSLGFMSITHTDGVAAAAFSFAPVGIDAEAYRNVNEKLAKKALAPCEYERWQKADDRSLAFLYNWTAKESYLKLTGEGIGGGMAEVMIDPFAKTVTKPNTDRRCRYTQLMLKDEDGSTGKTRAILTVCCDPGIEPVFIWFSDPIRLLIYLNMLR